MLFNPEGLLRPSSAERVTEPAWSASMWFQSWTSGPKVQAMPAHAPLRQSRGGCRVLRRASPPAVSVVAWVTC